MPDSTSHSEINLEELAERISEGHRAIKQMFKQASCNALHIALDVGQALIQAQSGVPAGKWEGWLKGRCPRRSAYLYMQVARHKAEIEAALAETPTLSLRAAHRLIAKPKPKISAAGDQPAREPRNLTRAMRHRRMKLGDGVADSLKGTSLESVHEQDQLIMLNRGAARGELTPIVKRLIADAIAGKAVSAVTESNRLNVTGRIKHLPTLLEFWRKNAIAVWQRANKDEQGKFIEYLIESCGGIGSVSSGEIDDLKARPSLDDLGPAALLDLLETKLQRAGIDGVTTQLRVIRKRIAQTRPALDLEAVCPAGSA